MAIETARIQPYLQSGDLPDLFIEELGWDQYPGGPLVVDAGQRRWALRGVAQKRGLAVLAVPPDADGAIPARPLRQRIEREVARRVHEHLLIFADAAGAERLWQWARREPGGPIVYREHRQRAGQGDAVLVERLQALAFSLDEEARLGISDVTSRVRAAFDVDRVTRRFYDRFKAEHGAFLGFIEGLAAQGEREWYASLMLNRLMFVYFIQKKGFLDGDRDYLRNRLRAVRARRGDGQFHSFYRYFLLRLFHDGLGGPRRDPELERLLGSVPYLNGGLFDRHQLERENPELDIADEAFARIFDFFDAYQWRLDERPLRDEREINPDVLGYIFEKYINQKQMGAYYTKEDITGYIAGNVIVPHLLDRVAGDCPGVLGSGGSGWGLLRDDPDRYIPAAMRHGVDLPLPAAIAVGERDIAARGEWNRRAEPAWGLALETWREHLARREHCRALRARLRAGEIRAIDDLVTLNLDGRQFAHDLIAGDDGPALVRAFDSAIAGLTILDPTCGSGAFLFAALQILQPLYDSCLDRMRAAVEEDPEHGDLDDFRATLALLAAHPNRPYFILKRLILNNLYGVDIMEEAAEICKLRLFLKLAAQLEPRPGLPNHGLEPLPDIDFNIRAGNTLVGLATDGDLAHAIRGDGQGRLDLFGDLGRLEERARSIDLAYDAFRDTQLRRDPAAGPPVVEKRALREGLAGLRDELDRHLAGEYGVDPERSADVACWRASHRPFHWLVEFHAIMRSGGFAAIIGNPPYVGYGKVREQYRVRGYATESCGNLYAFAIERSLALLRPDGRCGMIVPIASVATDGMRALQDLYAGRAQWHAHYAVRPAKLFDGVDMNLTISLLRGRAPGTATGIDRAPVFGTGYRRWSGGDAGDRAILFDTLRYTEIGEWRSSGHASPYPKLGSELESAILRRMHAHGRKLRDYQAARGETLYYHSGGRYWRKALPSKLSSHYKPLTVARELAPVVFALLNSQLFYWYWIGNSNCMDVVSREVLELPVFDLHRADSTAFSALGDRLLASYYAGNTTRQRRGERINGEEINFDVRRAKPIIDEIDLLLARHYGLTTDEADAILNYDVKYRLARDDNGVA